MRHRVSPVDKSYDRRRTFPRRSAPDGRMAPEGASAPARAEWRDAPRGGRAGARVPGIARARARCGRERRHGARAPDYDREPRRLAAVSPADYRCVKAETRGLRLET